MQMKKKSVTKRSGSKPLQIDWNKGLLPLLKKYRGMAHPLQYANQYQLIIMIVLSARASDAMVNTLAPKFFSLYPSFNRLAKATPQELYPILRVPGFRKKAEWIIDIAQRLSAVPDIPKTMKELVTLKGFGRKSANVFMSQIGVPAEGVIVDLHTMRVAPRLGIAVSSTPEKIERALMLHVKKNNWHKVGMALTYHGRETCRPTNPHCEECVVKSLCRFYQDRSSS